MTSLNFLEEKLLPEMVMDKVDSSLVTSVSLKVDLKGPPAFDVLNTNSHLHP